ncbi:tetratricopeptide repeat protein, partial [Micromonospora carbonacea]
REVGDRAGEAIALSNIGHAYDGLGDRQKALDHYHQALPIQREVGNSAGEIHTRYNIAMLRHAGGDLDQAIQQFEHIVELERQVDHPNLEDDTAILEHFRREHAATREPI